MIPVVVVSIPRARIGYIAHPISFYFDRVMPPYYSITLVIWLSITGMETSANSSYFDWGRRPESKSDEFSDVPSSILVLKEIHGSFGSPDLPLRSLTPQRAPTPPHSTKEPQHTRFSRIPRRLRCRTAAAVRCASWRRVVYASIFVSIFFLERC